MAVRKHKSHLDRLVGMNRGGKKKNNDGVQRSRKFNSKPGPPESNPAVLAQVQADVEQAEEAEVEQPNQPVLIDPDLPVTAHEEASPEDLLDELVGEDASGGSVGVQNESSPVSSSTLSSDKPAPKPLGSSPSVRNNNDPNFRRPSAAPLRPSTPASQSDDSAASGQVVLDLDSGLFREYANQKLPGEPLRHTLTRRLRQCVNHNSDKAIYLTSTHLRKIQQSAHRDFSSAEELVGWLVSNSDVFIGGQSLDIDPSLLQKAIDRKDPDRTLAQWLSELLEYGMMEKFGIR